nr:hypothetical protein [Anaerolineae bacterium]
MKIHLVNTDNRKEVNRFIGVPFELYRDSPQWVPPVVPDAQFQLNRKKNPFYKYNDAAFFVAEQDGQYIGRIAAFNPRYFNSFKHTSNLHFYLFDCINDQAAASALFEAAANWGRANDLTLCRGPLGFMALDGFGMLAEGFDHRPAVGIPYNYDYYPTLTEAWGFELEERVYSGYLNLTRLRAEFPQKILALSDKIKSRYGFTIKTFKNKRELRRWAAPRLADLYNRTLTHIAGDPPVTQEEVSVVADSALQITEPDLLKFVLKEDELVGFLFCFLDISVALKKTGGRLFPTGIFHILREMKRTNWINLNGMGMAPEYQGLGGTALMYAELYRAIENYPRFEHADVVQISEFNAKSLNEMKRFGVDFYKTHHIYQKPL